MRTISKCYDDFIAYFLCTFKIAKHLSFKQVPCVHVIIKSIELASNEKFPFGKFCFSPLRVIDHFPSQPQGWKHWNFWWKKNFWWESSKHSFNFTLVLISIEKPLILTWGRDFPPSLYHAFKWLPSFSFTYFLASFSTLCSAFDSLNLSKRNWKYESLNFVHLTSIKEKAQECSYISCLGRKLDFVVESLGLSLKIRLDLFALVYCVFLFTSRAITASDFM